MDHDPGAVFTKARPDDDEPPSKLDVKQAMREGYRTRRQRRALVGGAATAGVAAVAAVLALSLTGLPGTGEGPPAGQDFGFDPAHAGYPYAPQEEWAVPQPELDAAAREAFGELAVEGGFLDAGALDYELPSDDEVTEMMASSGRGYYEALTELGYVNLALHFTPWSVPGNGVGVHLRGYAASDGDEEAERSAFTLTALQPGGWTVEPGPVGDAQFPQHLLDDGPSWTDEAPVFTSEDSGDGRTVMIADHGCALEAAVVYPNGSALQSAWDLDCEGQGRELSVADLRAAMLAMPETDFDTGELALPESALPPGWAFDEDWPAEVEAELQASVTGVTDAVEAAVPGAELASTNAVQLQFGGAQAVRRQYSTRYELPYIDANAVAVNLSVGYVLPGGWTEGLPADDESGDAYLLSCGADKPDVCETTEVDGRTVATRVFDLGDNEARWVVVFDPAGWAVAVETSHAGPIEGWDMEALVSLAVSLPAPVYDPAAYEID